MKAFDPKGEYTPEEVRKALLGVNNTRNISYRYDRLDRFNNYIEPIDYVQKATIELNKDADIKRTAKFEMLDSGAFNFLQDRIKPYARLEMPKDGNYYERVRTLAPAVWWKFDEPSPGLGLTETTTIANATGYKTRETAYVIPTRAAGINTIIVTSDNLFWSVFENTSTAPVKIVLNPNNEANVTRYTIYYSATTTDDLTTIETGTFTNSGTVADIVYTIPDPQRGYYYIEQSYVSGTNANMRFHTSVSRQVRIEDATINRFHGYADNLNLGGEKLIKNAASAASTGDSSNLFGPGWRLANTFVYLDAYNEEPRNGHYFQTGQVLGLDKIPSRAGDQFYIEFIAKPFNKSGSVAFPQIAVGIFATTTANGEGPGWTSSIYNSSTTKVQILENGWAKYTASPYLDPSWDTVANAQLAFKIIPEGSTVNQNWLIDDDSIIFIKKANNGYSTGASDKSLMPATGKPQIWQTKTGINMPVGKALSINYWQKLGAIANQFSSSLVFNVLDSGSITIASSHTPGQAAVFTATIVVSTPYESFTYQSTLSVGETLFDAQAHMITLRAIPNSDSITLYIDASKVGTFVLGVGSPLLSTTTRAVFNDNAVIDSIAASFSTTATANNYIDDLSIYNRDIGVYNLTDMFSFGKSSQAIRRGYVEWPLGVFVPSAPNRKMENGNTVYRSVDAYDQLLVLSEDTFVDRYSVSMDTKYTTAISQVLQTVVGVQGINAATNIWLRSSTANSVTPETINFTGSGRYESLAGKITLKDVSISAKVPNVSTFSFGIINPATGIVAGETVSNYFYKTSTNLYIADETSSFLYTVGTYSPVTHAYLRVRESNGIIYYEYSANGVDWTIAYSYVYYNTITSGYANSYRKETSTVILGFVPSAAGVLSAFRVTATAAIESRITPSSLTLANAMEWEPGTSKLTVINDLLAAINYESAKFDEDGLFIAEPYISPTVRPAEFTYITNKESVITGDVEQTIDLFNIPNTWVLVVSNPEGPAMVSKYVNDDPNSVTSTLSRGRVIVDFRTEQDAATQLVLDAKVYRLAVEASQVYEYIEFTTGAMPIHQNNDIYNLVIDGLVINDKYSETSWSLELAPGALMKHRVRKLVYIS